MIMRGIEIEQACRWELITLEAVECVEKKYADAHVVLRAVAIPNEIHSKNDTA